MSQDEATAPRSSLGMSMPLLVLVTILFGLVVGYGWLRLLATAIDPLAAGFVGALITVIAILLARMMGGVFVQGSHAQGFWAKLILLYPILFVISALGTINAAFYNFEGSSVLEQVIDDADVRIAKLDAVTRSTSRNPVSDERAARVERLLTLLDAEITHQDNCGVGPVARGIIQQIHAIIPSFDVLSQRAISRTCDTVALRNLANTYRDLGRRMLAQDPETSNRDALRADIVGPLSSARAGLNTAKTMLAGGGGFGKNYGQAQNALESAATIYSDARAKLADARPAAVVDIPATIDTSRSRNLGSIFAMPGTLAARIGYASTWIYFLVAVLLDLFLVFMFVETLRSTQPVAARLPAPRVSDPQFLWVNQGA